MTAPEVRAWIDANMTCKLRQFGMGHWRVGVIYERKKQHEDGFQPFMSMSSKFQYEKATMYVDAEICAEHNTAEETELMTEHEIAHMIHSPFDLVWSIANDFLDEKQMEAFSTAFSHAEELTVRNIERLVYALRNGAGAAEQPSSTPVAEESSSPK